jgi:hypothetical protein
MAVLTIFISTRKTRSGDYLIFEAVPYRLGIGVATTGSKGSGYTTGHQFGRADTESEAVAAAEAIVVENDDETCHWILIDWQPPMDKNLQFVDLDKKYPQAKDFETKAEAETAGWVYINPSKTIEWYRGRVLKCVDVSGGDSFGYDFAIKIKGEVSEFATSKTIGIGRMVSARFRSGDVVDGILAARQWIDADLITIKEAASLTGKSIQSLSGMVSRGTVTGYTNEGAPKRQGRTLVSRAQFRRLGMELSND